MAQEEWERWWGVQGAEEMGGFSEEARGSLRKCGTSLRRCGGSEET